MTTATAFDHIAARYDDLWTNSPIGRLQREAVWRHAAPFFKRPGTVLDLGCGTGEDSLRLMNTGHRVVAIDPSKEMVRIARGRGVDARALSIENLDMLNGSYDGAISNFGAINCVKNLTALRNSLWRVVRSGGPVAICLFGRVCLWETAYYFLHGEPAKMSRRWRRKEMNASPGVQVFYHSVREFREVFEPRFRFVRQIGIGLCVPPSYVRRLPSQLLETFDKVDHKIAHWPIARALADHVLLIFVAR